MILSQSEDRIHQPLVIPFSSQWSMQYEDSPETEGNASVTFQEWSEAMGFLNCVLTSFKKTPLRRGFRVVVVLQAFRAYCKACRAPMSFYL